MSAINVHGLSKRFGDVLAVDGLGFEVEEGTVVGFLGPNGAGKTTTLRMLLGLVTPTAGTATSGGRAAKGPLVIFALILGVLGMSGEFRHGTATPTFLVTPQRGRVVAAKVVAYALAGVALAAASAGVATPTMPRRRSPRWDVCRFCADSRGKYSPFLTHEERSRMPLTGLLPVKEGGVGLALQPVPLIRRAGSFVCIVRLPKTSVRRLPPARDRFARWRHPTRKDSLWASTPSQRTVDARSHPRGGVACAPSSACSSWPSPLGPSAQRWRAALSPRRARCSRRPQSPSAGASNG